MELCMRTAAKLQVRASHRRTALARRRPGYAYRKASQQWYDSNSWNFQLAIMAIVKIKDKFQVTLPGSLRQQAGLAVGDFLEAKLEKGNITLVPKRLVDRRIEES